MRFLEIESLPVSALEGVRVLVLEDEYLIALDVEQLCRDHGARDVVIVRDFGELGPDLLADEPFHAAVLDLMLGGKPTTDFARLLAQRSVPFIFATGYTDVESMLDGFAGVPVVGKPYAGRDLIAALEQAIGRRREPSGGV